MGSLMYRFKFKLLGQEKRNSGGRMQITNSLTILPLNKSGWGKFYISIIQVFTLRISGKVTCMLQSYKNNLVKGQSSQKTV